jgi:gas vesicle protein GvpN
MAARPTAAHAAQAAQFADASPREISPGADIEVDPTLMLQPRPDFVGGPAVEALADRAFSYLHGGYPVHFRGPAGSGKTTLALHLAARIGRPVMLLVGDATFDTRSLVGGEGAMRTKRVVDRYITSVMKVESETAPVWMDRALTIAVTDGCTLVYDEFNRAPAAANNVLLTVLEERVLVLPRAGRGECYLRVHPQFRIIFTSNPSDHVGAHLAQDALLDRMITIDVDCFDRDTEVSIVAARSGLPVGDAARVVDMVRDFRRSGEFTQRPSLRAGLMISRLAAQHGMRVASDDPRFLATCLDVLGSRLKPGPYGLPEPTHRQMLTRLVEHFCPATGAAQGGAR